MSFAHRFKLPNSVEEIEVAVIIPRGGDSWGALSSIRGTPWASLVREVSGESLSHARHGYLEPFLREMGSEPRSLLKRLKSAACMSAVDGTCPIASASCVPGPKTPECYVPPSHADHHEVILELVLLCRDGVRIVVPVGDEFSFR